MDDCILREECLTDDKELFKLVIQEGDIKINKTVTLWIYYDSYIFGEKIKSGGTELYKVQLGERMNAVFRKGWIIALPTMKKDEICWLRMTPKYHFGRGESQERNMA